ncbi:MAG: hypothetical protein AAGC55_10700 [Myxococcota bacterium]
MGDNGIQTNGIQTNGIQLNGIQLNGIQLNSIQLNGIQLNSLQLNGVPMDAQQGADMLVLFEYMTECALAPEQSADFYDHDGMLHTFFGALSLAPAWRDGPLDHGGQRKVSACLAARSNQLGVNVSISMRGADILATELERVAYEHYEGTFWGNLFVPESHIEACTVSGGGLAGRVCSDPDNNCGFNFVGECATVCATQDPLDGHFSDCAGEEFAVSVFLNLSTRQTHGQQRSACAIADDKSVWCWGENGSGQLGDGTTIARTSPAAIADPTNDASEVSVGGHHSCMRNDRGGLSCWGENSDGQLGDGSNSAHTSPVAIAALGDQVAEVVAGAAQTCIIRADSDVMCAGDNSYGQLGDGSSGDRNTFAAVSLASGAVALSAGSTAHHVCAVDSAGQVACWGRNDVGQLGVGTTVHSNTPLAISHDDLGHPFGDVIDLCASQTLTCAHKLDGSAWCWGQGFTRPTHFALSRPVAPGGLSCGERHACFILDNGNIWCMGANDSGQLGFPTGGATTWSPGRVSGLGDAIAINAASGHTCAELTDGTTWCWGARDPSSALFAEDLSPLPTAIPLAIGL